LNLPAHREGFPVRRGLQEALPVKKVINKKKELLVLLKKRIYRFAEFHGGK